MRISGGWTTSESSARRSGHTLTLHLVLNSRYYGTASSGITRERALAPGASTKGTAAAKIDPNISRSQSKVGHGEG